MGLAPGEADGLGPWREGGGRLLQGPRFVGPSGVGTRGGHGSDPKGVGPKGVVPRGDRVVPGCWTMWVGPGG